MVNEISTIIIAKNEERTLHQCLLSVQSITKEIIVVDSESTDNTVKIAKEFTDKVFIHPWSGYTPQKQFALSKASFNWILWIDADEVLSPALSKEVSDCSFSHQGYAIPRLVWYMGRWIKHCGWYPDYVVRLFNRQNGSFTKTLIHESVSINGTIGKFKSPLFHYSYRSLSHHCQKMNSFTSLHAQQHRSHKILFPPLSLIVNPLFYFFKSYIFRQGFRDGIPGLTVSMMGSFYTFLKYSKRWELNNINQDEKTV